MLSEGQEALEKSAGVGEVRPSKLCGVQHAATDAQPASAQASLVMLRSFENPGGR